MVGSGGCGAPRNRRSKISRGVVVGSGAHWLVDRRAGEAGG